MRIISGKWRGKKLASFEGEQIRPTTDRIKESIFNMLSSNKFGGNKFHGSQILDCFAGTGSLGLEALSRGGSFAHMWDNSTKSIQIIKQNFKNIPTNLYTIKKTDAYNPRRTEHAVDIVFIDPPYAEMSKITTLLQELGNNNWINSDTLIVIESSSDNKPTLGQDYVILEEKHMGNTTVTFTEKNGADIPT